LDFDFGFYTDFEFSLSFLADFSDNFCWLALKLSEISDIRLSISCLVPCNNFLSSSFKGTNTDFVFSTTIWFFLVLGKTVGDTSLSALLTNTKLCCDG
jgi:hypothetical protein